MRPTANASAKGIVAAIFLVALVGSSLAVWGLAAQQRVSSDVHDVRVPALDPALPVEDHAIWTLEILNGRLFSDDEIRDRFSPLMLRAVPAERLRIDINRVKTEAPFELRGYTIDDDGALQLHASSRALDVLEIDIVLAPDGERIDGLLLVIADVDRGPFTIVRATSHLVAAWGLLLAGAGTWLLRHRPRPGRLFIASGLLWLAQLLELSSDAIPYTIGLVAGPIAVAVLAAALLSFHPDGVRGRYARWILALTVLAAALAIAPLLVIDTSVSNLPDQLLSLTHNPAAARSIGTAGHLAAIVGALAASALLVARGVDSASIGAQQRRFVAGSGVVIAGSIVVLAAWALAGDHFDLSQSAVISLMVLAVPSCILLASYLESRRALDGVTSMVADVTGVPSRSGLQTSLASALSDPSLELAFWSPDRGEYVTSLGHRAVVESSADRAVTFIGDVDAPIGAVLHDPQLLAEPDRVKAATAAAKMALENERRQALTAAELRASRARIVKSAEDARRAVERDLHDGAQQRLIALQLSLTLEQQRLARTNEPVDPAFLETMIHDLGGAIDELRELGRGLRPSALDNGLRTAVQSLAERSPLPIVTDVGDDRAPAAIEEAAYFVINEAVTNATRYSGADHVRVTVTSNAETLHVRVQDTGVGGAALGGGSGLQSLEDRVLALDGMWQLESPARGGTLVAATLPMNGQTNE